jgi:hypothetical protein
MRKVAKGVAGDDAELAIAFVESARPVAASGPLGETG